MDLPKNPARWVPRISGRAWFTVGNLVAGLAVGAYLIPQAMAYGSLAGIGPALGLATAVVPLLVYTVLGRHTWLSVGPESAIALMSAAAAAQAAHVTGLPVTVVLPTMAVLVGVILLVAWAARAAFLADLLSLPVLVGYLTGIAVLMVLSQLPKLTGIKMDTSDMWAMVSQTSWHWPMWSTLAVGLGVAVTAWAVPRKWPEIPGTLIALIVSVPVGMLLNVPTIGAVSTSIPSFAIPVLSPSLLLAMLGPSVAIAAVAYADVMVGARAFNDGRRVEPGREMVALAGSQIGTGMFCGYPVSASTSRTALAKASGATSQHYSLVVASVLVVAPLLFGAVLSRIPVAALAGVVIFAAVTLINTDDWKMMRRLHHSELAIAAGCAVSVLAFGILAGIGIAIALSVLAFLARVSRPTSSVLGFVPYTAGMHAVEEHWDAGTVPGLVVFRYNAPMFFINASDFFTKATDAVGPDTKVVVINMEYSANLDTTSLDTLAELATFLRAEKVELWLARTHHEVLVQMGKHGALDAVGHDCLYPTLPTAVAAYADKYPEAGVSVPPPPTGPEPGSLTL